MHFGGYPWVLDEDRYGKFLFNLDFRVQVESSYPLQFGQCDDAAVGSLHEWKGKIASFTEDQDGLFQAVGWGFIHNVQKVDAANRLLSNWHWYSPVQTKNVGKFIHVFVDRWDNVVL